MSVSAALLKAMQAAGCSIEQIVEIVEREEKERLELKREQNRIRQQNHRARNAKKRDRHDVTRDSVTAAGESEQNQLPRNASNALSRVTGVTSPLIKKNPPHPPKEINPSLFPLSPINGASAPTPKKPCRLPCDFEPDHGVAIEIGLTEKQAVLEAAKFRDYWTAESGSHAVKRDWPAVWRNWCRKALEIGPRLGPPRATSPPGEAQDAAWRAVLRRAQGKEF